jgi:hypothetical protein
MIGYAKQIGLNIAGKVDMRCRERVAQHLGCAYTFLNLLFCR